MLMMEVLIKCWIRVFLMGIGGALSKIPLIVAEPEVIVMCRRVQNTAGSPLAPNFNKIAPVSKDWSMLKCTMSQMHLEAKKVFDP